MLNGYKIVLHFFVFSKFAVSSILQYNYCFKGKSIFHHNVYTKKRITLKNINILGGGQLFAYFRVSQVRWLLKTKPRENRGLAVHELLHYTPANTFGFAARGQNPDSDVSNFKISIRKLKR
jgi:hypothetical protein